MCRYPPSTIHRYLDLPSTQIIQTHTSHRHNTTPPLPPLVQAPYPLPTYTSHTHTTATKTQTHVQHSPCPHRISKGQTQFSHPLTPLSTHTARAKHIYMSHTPPTPLTSMSHVLDKTPEPRGPLIHALTATTPHPDPPPPLPSPSHPHTLTAHTHATQTTVHASQSPQQPRAQHRVLRQPHKQTKDYHRTTNTTQTHRPSSKSERNLIILQVNINVLRNKLEELKLLIHDTHADIITIQESSSPLKPKHQKYITSQQCTPIGCTRQDVGSLHSFETTSHSLQQTYLRLLIHTTQNIKWSRYTLTTLNKSQ